MEGGFVWNRREAADAESVLVNLSRVAPQTAVAALPDVLHVDNDGLPVVAFPPLTVAAGTLKHDDSHAILRTNRFHHGA